MFQEIKTADLKENAFDLIGKQWLLVTAGKPDGSCNTMTASWGGLGVMWGKDVAFLVIRPQRYTKEFIDSSDTLSISVLPDGYKKQYGYLGSVSGRDEDKIAKVGLSVIRDGDTPYFEEARIAMICRKLFAQPYDPDCILDKTVDKNWYPEKDYHTLYICEIEKVLVNQA
ncbi:MAG: flavin reductase [Lachnospiraceae bacterium]|nr:flavin reductase [Lachnospiraceae bacterium]